MYFLITFLVILYLDFAHSNCKYATVYKVSNSYGFIQNSYITNDSKCIIWKIELGYYNIIEIRIESVNLDTGEFISIHDGISPQSPRLMKMYRKSNFQKLTTSSGSAFIFYQKRPFSRQPKFNITYQIKGVCIPRIQLPCSESELNCFDIRYERCNSVWNCPLSGKDERNCPACRAQIKKTNKMHFPCSSSFKSQCYSIQGRCDGIEQCETIADEMYCDPVQCGAHNKTFLCQSYPSRCISDSLKCDGAITCKDGSDELNCAVIIPYYNSSRIRMIVVSTISVILCVLMVVLGFICICRLHKMRILATRNLARNRGYLSQYDSSIQQLLDEQMRRGPPPPDYNYSLGHSRPFKSISDLQKIIRSQSKSSEVKYKRLTHSCQYSNETLNEALPTTNSTSNSVSNNSVENDAQLLVPDMNTDIDSFNDNRSDVDLIDPGVVDHLIESGRYQDLNTFFNTVLDKKCVSNQ